MPTIRVVTEIAGWAAPLDQAVPPHAPRGLNSDDEPGGSAWCAIKDYYCPGYRNRLPSAPFVSESLLRRQKRSLDGRFVPDPPAWGNIDQPFR